MHTVIVYSHPKPHSLTKSLALKVAVGISENGHGDTAELADLAAEGFDPRFSLADFAVHQKEAPAPADVVAEQARLDRADALVLVFPVYWWSMPALLKGSIDRVFSNGWAYDFSPDTPVTKKLQRLQIHLIGVGGADAGTYDRHGYHSAMKTQIDHGIFDYCGAKVITSQLFLDADSLDPSAHLESAYHLGRGLFAMKAAHPSGHAA